MAYFVEVYSSHPLARSVGIIFIEGSVNMGIYNVIPIVLKFLVRNANEQESVT